MTPTEVMIQIVQSLEAQILWASNTYELHARYVAELYRTYLEREPDSGGLTYWVGKLEADALTMQQVESAILSSDEYQNLQNIKALRGVSLLQHVNGNLEVVAPLQEGSLAHYYRNPAREWHGPTAKFGSDLAGPVAMIQNVNGNLEVVARTIQGRLVHYYRNSSLNWNGPTAHFGEDIAGDVSLIQQTNGNFEVVTRMFDKDLVHFFRDAGCNWHGPTASFGQPQPQPPPPQQPSHEYNGPLYTVVDALNNPEKYLGRGSCLSVKTTSPLIASPHFRYAGGVIKFPPLYAGTPSPLVTWTCEYFYQRIYPHHRIDFHDYDRQIGRLLQKKHLFL
jgi:hypothetical protein